MSQQFCNELSVVWYAGFGSNVRVFILFSRTESVNYNSEKQITFLNFKN